jgi:hypothetical protein
MATTTIMVNEVEDKQLARPPHVLVPLIKKDLGDAREASERAGMPYYRAAGDKMLEAKPQMKHTEFEAWIKRHFGISYQQASRYMKLVTIETSSTARSLNAFLRESGDPGYVPNKPRPQPWHEPVKETLEKVDVERLNRGKAEMKRAEEREAERRLALQLIDIGYKALATKLHPDKGGSRDAMTRLNRVRDRLRQSA